jgi:hypothetical protein
VIRWLGSVIMRRHGASEGRGGGGDGGGGGGGLSDAWLWADASSGITWFDGSPIGVENP